MFNLTLASLATGLGIACAVLHLPGVLKPAVCGALLRKFPRWTPIGVLFTLLGTGWFLFYVSQETVSDFASIKTALYYFFGAVGLATCFFVRDFLPVRGLSVLLLLAAKLVTEKARIVESDWRLVLVTWAYLWVFLGMWFTISPWRVRDLIEWGTASPARTRLWSGGGLLFGLFIAALGLTVLR